MPGISVVIPCHNHGGYVAGTIQSVLDQRYPPTEIIIIDDGSTDDTAAVVQSIKDERIKYVFQSNSGPSSARNHGLKFATGEYIGFLDADDCWHQNFLSSIIPIFEKHPEIAVIGSGLNYLDFATQKIYPGPIPLKPDNLLDLLERNCFPVSASLYKTAKIRAVGGFDEELFGVEDWEILIRLFCLGEEIEVMQERLIDYRIVPKSLSKNLGVMEENVEKMIDKLNKQFPSNSVIQSQSPRLKALRLLDIGSGYLAIDEPETASEKYSRAISAFPEVLYELHFYYTILCAKQPLQFRGTGDGIDTNESLRTLHILMSSLSKNGLELNHKQSAIMNSAIARLFYSMDEMKKSRKYWLKACSNNPTIAIRNGCIGYMGKSILGAENINRIKNFLN